jgi:putative ABC transport system permease protein
MSGTRRIDPPALAGQLLEAALGNADRADAILGDLYEEHQARLAGSPLRAHAWYCAHAFRIGVRAIANDVMRRVTPRTAPPPSPSTPAGDSLMRTLGLETRHAARSILKRPALSAIVVLTLALGLGANAAIFGIIDALVLRPFTIPDVDRIALVANLRPGESEPQQSISPADFFDLRDQLDSFAHLAAFDYWDANLVGRDEPERVPGFQVSSDFFAVLGVQPALGRPFLRSEETVGNHRRVMLGHGLWQRRFASDPTIVGRAIEIDGHPHEVVGVAPPGFEFPMAAQIWSPLAFTAEQAAGRRNRYLSVIGRLAPGRSLDDAKVQAAVVSERLARQYPETNKGYGGYVYTLPQGMMDVGLGPVLSMWQASAGFVLLIACANVASLLLARGAERQREMAVRLAMGASRWRVVREMLIESVLLALIAVPTALAFAWLTLAIVRGAMPERIVRFVAGWQMLGVTGRLALFTGLMALATAVVFGLVPALQASRPRLAESLKEGGRTSSAGGKRTRLRRGLVVAEIALALPLLVASGLSALTVHRFLNGPQGYSPDGVLSMSMVLNDRDYADAPARRRFAVDLVERLQATPGVTAVAAANIVPGVPNNSGRSIEIDGRPNPDPLNPPQVDFRATTPGLFATLGIPVFSGRGFTDADRQETQPVAIVSQSLARQYWPSDDPIGRRIRIVNGEWLTVVGVCGDVIHNWFNRRNYPTLYLPFDQSPAGSLSVLVKTSGDAASVAGPARAAVRAVDPSQPVFDVMSLRTRLHERTIGLQYIAGIMVVFGGLALVLSVVGIYGVMAYMVTQRTHEIGVRIALGATRRDVMRLTVGQTGRLTAVGVALGLVLSVGLMRLIEAGLLGVTSGDPRLTAAFAAVLVLAALTAGYLPARRATSIDPMVALREE